MALALRSTRMLTGRAGVPTRWLRPAAAPISTRESKAPSAVNKKDLVEIISKQCNVTKKDTDAVVTAFVNAVMEQVAAGEKVSLVGFGTFEPRERKEREGRNPKTQEKITIPSVVTPGFSAGKSFKDIVRNGKAASKLAATPPATSEPATYQAESRKTGSPVARRA